MRSLLWMVLLGVAAGGGLLWLSAPDEEPLDAQPLHGGQPAPEAAPAALPAPAARPGVVVIEGAERWPVDLLRDGRIFGDPGVVDDLEVAGPTGEPYRITGAQLLRILERDLGERGFRFRFRDAETLAAFKQCRPKDHLPVRAPLRLVLDQFLFTGFAFVAYGGKVYVTTITPGELPGAVHDAPPPVEASSEPARIR